MAGIGRTRWSAKGKGGAFGHSSPHGGWSGVAGNCVDGVLLHTRIIVNEQCRVAHRKTGVDFLQELQTSPLANRILTTLGLYCASHGCVSRAASHARMAPMVSAFPDCRADSTDPRPDRHSALVMRNVRVRGRRTSIRLEPQIWDTLAEMCRREFCTPHDVTLDRHSPSWRCELAQ